MDGVGTRPDTERSVMVVDDEPIVTATVAGILGASGYACRTASRADDALASLAAEPAGVVITDINMPGHNGLWLLSELRGRFEDTAVIMLSGMAELDTAVSCLRDGASDFLTKPIRAAHLLTTVDRALERRRLVLENRAYQHDLEVLVREATSELQEAYRQISETYQMTLEALCSALDARAQETADHSQRVTALTLAIAATLGVRQRAVDEIARGALLHDIGKIGVPDHILLKPASLDADEWRTMRRHPEIGHYILSGIPFLRAAAELVLSHHEWYDGSGYPERKRGQEIPLGARIFSVADAVDAIASDRPYRRAGTVADAMAEINRFAGSQFDPQVVEAANTIGETEIREIFARARAAARPAADP